MACDVEGPENSVRKILSEIETRGPVSIETIKQFLETARAKPIVIQPLASLNGSNACGLWVSTAHTELILHAVTSSELHRQQVVLHEFAHMLLKHDKETIFRQRVSTLMLNVTSERIEKVLARSDFTDNLEAAAESLADRLARAIRQKTLPTPNQFERFFG